MGIIDVSYLYMIFSHCLKYIECFYWFILHLFLLIKECGAHSFVWLSLIYLFTSQFL